jgi:SAM-dependent methyltransferase
LRVRALDYSAVGLAAIRRKAQALGLAGRVTAVAHDVRRPLPFPDGAFDACYSHMLWCMALTLADLEALAREVRRVLRPGGLNVYTVRHVGDPRYGVGPHRGENMYEDPAGGFIVHVFSREMVEHLADGYDLLEVEPFEEGKLPRKLFRMTLRKPTAVATRAPFP